MGGGRLIEEKDITWKEINKVVRKHKLEKTPKVDGISVEIRRGSRQYAVDILMRVCQALCMVDKMPMTGFWLLLGE